MEPDGTRRTRLGRDPTNAGRESEILEALSARTRRAEGELTLFFDQSLDLLCIAGFDGYFKRLNPAWTTRLGWTQQQLTRRPFLDFVHADDRQATAAEVGRLAAGATTVLFENRYRHRAGSYRWLQWNARPVPGRRRIYATARDVTRLKRLEHEVLEIVDRERERLGRELHDGLCQTLAGIAALSSTLSRRLAASSQSGASAEAAEIARLLNETIGQTRDLARGLGPVDLRAARLDEALEALALNVRQLFRVSCIVGCDRAFPRLARKVEAHLFRVAQEAVNNAVAHGRADRIEIGLRSKGRTGLLSVRDNGVGVPEETPGSDGIGLRTMAYRARLIGGSLDVRRRARHGTAVTCSFSLAETTDTGETEDDAAEET